MDTSHNPKLRLGMTLQQAVESSFHPGTANGLPLPAVNYGLVGKQTASLLPTGNLPEASAVAITRADAAWAALNQVFCAGSSGGSSGRAAGVRVLRSRPGKITLPLATARSMRTTCTPSSSSLTAPAFTTRS